MFRILCYPLAALFTLSALSACFSSGPITGPSAGRLLLDQAADAMGGWTAMDQITSQEIHTTGMDWEPLQAIEPTAEPRQINSFDQILVLDYINRRMRLTFDASRTYPTVAPVRFVEVLNSDSGMLEPAKERLHPSRLATRLRDYNRLPLRVLYTAKAASDLTRAEDLAVEGATVHVLKYTDGNAPVVLHLDSQSHLPIRVIYMEDDPVWGDTHNELLFSGWMEHNGLRLPHTQITRLNGIRIREEHVTDMILNPGMDEASFAIPETVKAQPEIGERIVSQWILRRVAMGVAYQDFGREQKVDLIEVKPGVYHVRGASHHSMVVEMKDHLVVVEAPLFEERSVAVIRALEVRFPGKPIRHLVVTHFHFDHSGGVRAYAAAGATIVVPESIVPFVRDVLARPHTLRPDSLAKATSTPAVQAVSGIWPLSDGERTLELRSIENDHATGMLFAYLPKEKVVFVSDLYSPPGPVPNPSVIFERGRAAAFYNALMEAGLAVETIIGGHGVVGSIKDLEKAVKAP